MKVGDSGKDGKFTRRVHGICGGEHSTAIDDDRDWLSAESLHGLGLTER